MSESIRKRLMAEYSALRRNNERVLQEHISTAESKSARIAELRRRKQNLWFKATQQALAANVPVNSEALKLQYRQYDRDIADCLQELGLPEDYLEMHHHCDVCHDMGYVGDTVRTDCECFQQRYLEELQNGAPLVSRNGSQTFEAFNEDCFSTQHIPELPQRTYREYMARVRGVCERYANDYPNLNKPNLLLLGASGLGKTFLLNCIAQRLIGRGYPVLYVTGYNMFQAMRSAALGNSELFDSMVEAPMLMIDDLGSEPQFKNISTEYLFCLLNERLNSRRHTLIATNYSPENALQRYTERVSSRMFDHSSTTVITLYGADLRTTAKPRESAPPSGGIA